MWDLRARIKRGLEVRRQVFGDVDEMEWKRSSDEFDPEFHGIMLGFRWGHNHGTPGH